MMSVRVAGSWPAPGDCATGGNYAVGTGEQAYLVNQTTGTWGDAQAVTGLAALNVNDDADTLAVSCISAGNCATGGYYTTANNFTEAFIASETDGTWGTVTQVLGAASMPSATVTSVSCPAAGDCVAGGGYPPLDGGGDEQGFITSEAHGEWSAALGLGPVNENVMGSADITSVSCRSAGYCAAVGFSSTTAYDVDEMYAVDETGGTWGTARAIPESDGSATGSGWGQLSSVSCGARGSCSAFGFFNDKLPAIGTQAFVVSEVPVTRTVLSLTAAKVAFGNERADRFSVAVSAASGTPAGAVSVMAGAQVVCRVTLLVGKGSCVTAAVTHFAVGSVTLTARYPGDGPLFGGSSSAGVRLVIQPEPTKTSLSLSTRKALTVAR